MIEANLGARDVSDWLNVVRRQLRKGIGQKRIDAKEIVPPTVGSWPLKNKSNRKVLCMGTTVEQAPLRSGVVRG